MRQLRKPNRDQEITPELLDPIVENLRKLSNLSGRGCTVHELPNGIAIDVPKPNEPRRGRLMEPLYGCGQALAVEICVDIQGNQTDGQQFTVTDPLNKVDGELLAVPDEESYLYLPAGTCFDSHHRSDSNSWEFDAAGNCCVEVSGEESSEASKESEESEESERSEHSEESQESAESQASQESQISQASEESEGSKAAIVPAKWSPSGYAALFITEMPEVRFEDIMVVDFPPGDPEIELSDPSRLFSIDPKYLDTIVSGSAEVCGIAPDLPVAVGAKVEGADVRVRVASIESVRIVLRLTGIRKGFAGVRLPPKTRKQFLANERFIKKAYHG